jgi:hypothetical protein
VQSERAAKRRGLAADEGRIGVASGAIGISMSDLRGAAIQRAAGSP